MNSKNPYLFFSVVITMQKKLLKNQKKTNKQTKRNKNKRTKERINYYAYKTKLFL